MDGNQRSAVAALAVLLFSTGAGAASFTGVGDLPGGDTSSFASGVSAEAHPTEGYVVVGRSSTGTVAGSDFQAFRWTQSSGMSPATGLGDLAGGDLESQGMATSADGSRVVGVGTIATGSEAFRWDAPAGPMLGLGHLDPDGSSPLSVARSVSADGGVIVGRSNSTADSGTGFEAFVWRQSTGAMTSLGDFADGPTFSEAHDVSADGTVVVGAGLHTGGVVGSEAAMWVDDGTGFGPIVGLGSLTGGTDRSLALGVSGDGETAVGAASSTASHDSQAGALEAFRKVSVLSMEGLGDLDGGIFDSAANAASFDGSVIVGRGTAADGDRAFIWTQAAGMLDLNAVATAAGIDLTGWLLTEATDVSADGLTIVGHGVGPSGNEGWILTLDFAPVPEPGTGLLLALGLGALGLRRRLHL